jgi:hypothetical protein
MNALKLARQRPELTLGILAVVGFVLGSGKLGIKIPSLSPHPVAPPASTTAANVAATTAAPPASSSWLDSAQG